MTRIALFGADSTSAPWQAGVVRRLAAAGAAWDVFVGSGFGTFNAVSMASIENADIAARSLEARWRTIGDVRGTAASGDLSEMLSMLLTSSAMSRRLHVARSDFDAACTTVEQVSELKERHSLSRLYREAMSVQEMPTKGNDSTFLLRSSMFTSYAPVLEIMLQYPEAASVDVFCARSRHCDIVSESGLLRGDGLNRRDAELRAGMSLELSYNVARVEFLDRVLTRNPRPTIRWWFSSVPATEGYSCDQWFDVGLSDSMNKCLVTAWDT